MPSLAVNRKLKTFLEQLGDVQSVSMKLQSEDLSLLDARDLLNGLLEVMPSFVNYLDPKAEIVHSPDFESGARWSTPPPARIEDTTKVGFAERILKRRKVNDAPSAYVLLEAIPPTSNVVERLFSAARQVLRYERNRLSPLSLEQILFLKVNQKYWDVTTVDACI
ncbi:hypothetical protein F441_22645 [Phytophthora nicotianae CJ01A1]|uniref:HAT C-terminal dimerisation domain-containing protein n=1 Tax=Phytophthora nicotianae CJ01A1 TaxID=1317063 RepID=W2VP23_PHYNI|nr:hypothetical protein F441_22645 [Phytophthora nicotianae CJ01A1]